ncbi:hypothetical protein IQ06DRAFT_98998 [Phaeosphaeriaceae sp. SRC1lsM3a]|nr:hypothetical protein IQ06DRAFT_98998 [Stagonospora sp. SRC1lsM3a]
MILGGPQCSSEDDSDDECNDDGSTTTSSSLQPNADTHDIPGSHEQRQRKNRDSETFATKVLARASHPEGTGPSDGGATTALLSQKDLARLVRHYPDGELFTMTSSANGEVEISSSIKMSSRQDALDTTMYTKTLHRCFHTARQIILLPIWDTSISRWTICVAYHRSKYQHWTYKSHFVFCATLGNLVAAQLTKLTNLQVAKHKSDFIASISHELRTPLHGVLGSCEFLSDTGLSKAQQSLVGTAESCARTLLDTINMVLDYTDINDSEKVEGQATKPQHRAPEESQSGSLQTYLSTSRVVDIAALVEDVIHGLVAGHNFESRSNRSGSSSAGSSHASVSSTIGDSVALFGDGSADIILDIAARDWMYHTAPGSLRRIVMNLVGNALKFTKHGFVHVKLETAISNRTTKVPYLVMTVKDSGKGMSGSYLKNTLFSPFSQESSLTPGTGLGLTLVKSIVRTMGGTLSINSSLEIGTKVTLKIPLGDKSWGLNGASDMSLLHIDHVTQFERSMLISTVRLQALGKTGALHWHAGEDAPSSHSKALRLLQASLVTYLSQWFGLSLSPWQQGCSYDIIISTVNGLSHLEQMDPEIFSVHNGSAILVIGTTVLSASAAADTESTSKIVNLNCPFGPSTLAQALKTCLDKIVEPCTPTESESNASVERPWESCIESPSMGSTSTSSSGEQRTDMEKFTPPESDEDVILPPRPSLSIIQSNTTDVELSVEGFHNLEKHLVNGALSKPKLPRLDLCMLLVDDNAINLRLLQMYSKKLGRTDGHSAENGQIAVQIYERLLYATPSKPPDIILMDLSMPVMDGFEATRRIRSIEASYDKKRGNGDTKPRCFIIALSGLSSLKDRKAAFAAGVDRYMMKPTNFAQLSLLLDKWRSGSLDDADAG